MKVAISTPGPSRTAPTGLTSLFNLYARHLPLVEPEITPIP
jgi:hypothetical protein